VGQKGESEVVFKTRTSPETGLVIYPVYGKKEKKEGVGSGKVPPF